MNFVNQLIENLLSFKLAACGIAICFPLLGAGFWLRQRRRARQQRMVRQPLDALAADAWLAPAKSFDDKRRFLRRSDSFVEVQIFDPNKPKKVIEGIVVDRSVQGVGMAVRSSYPLGANLKIIATNAPDGTPWTEVTVRSCERCDDYFKIGCQFHEKLPWNILLLFG